MSTSSMTGVGSFSALPLLASSSFVATGLTTDEEEEGPAAEEECVPFFFTATDEAGTTFYFLILGGRTRTSSTSTFTSTTRTATEDEGTAVEEQAKCPVPGSLRLWHLTGFIISKGGGGREEARGVEGGRGEGGERRRSAWSVRVAK